MTAECVVLNLRAANKQELLAGLAERVAPAASQDGFDVFRALLARESQGSTSSGHGSCLAQRTVQTVASAVCIVCTVMAAN